MLKAIFNWFTGKPLPGTEAPAVQPQAAPYKVEAPVVAPTMTPATVSVQTKCGCGRSPTGLCVGLHKLTPAQWAAEQARGSCQKVNNSCDTPAEPCPPVEAAKKPVVKKPQTNKKPTVKKPAAKKPT